ncbi:MAG: hypothetical protein K2R98_14555, partial [Gemmataceae bacterium]|nr:hypothetical protein [Gemmataceae bacterium]
ETSKGGQVNLRRSGRSALRTEWTATPHLSVFLSGTDRKTLHQWIGVDPHARAVVVDVFADGFAAQCGAFDGNGQAVTMAAAPAPLPPELVKAFRQQLGRAYGRHNRPAPTVFLAGVQHSARAAR